MNFTKINNTELKMSFKEALGKRFTTIPVEETLLNDFLLTPFFGLTELLYDFKAFS